MLRSRSPAFTTLGALALACAALLAACASSGGRVSPGGSPGDARWLTGTWVGGYHCPFGYGDARLTLTLTGRRTGRLEGLFAFAVTEPFTQIQPGSFRVEGGYGANGAIRLTGTRWVEWPTGLKMVGLDGRADRAPDSLSGTVPECGEGAAFFLERVAAPE